VIIPDKCGLPEFVFADELSWFSFLDHGFYGKDWDREQFQLKDLPEKQLQELYAFPEFSTDEKLSIMAFTLGIC
jgi:hypothetical protein